MILGAETFHLTCGALPNPPPTVNILSPENASVVNSDFALDVAANDDDLLTLGCQVGNQLFETSTLSLVLNVSTLTEPDGPLVITCTATDSSGEAASDSRVVSVDNSQSRGDQVDAWLYPSFPNSVST